LPPYFHSNASAERSQARAIASMFSRISFASARAAAIFLSTQSTPAASVGTNAQGLGAGASAMSAATSSAVKASACGVSIVCTRACMIGVPFGIYLSVR